MRYIRTFVAAAALGLASGTANAIDTTGWTCSTAGSCGTLTADGDVTNAPVAGSSGYAWVSTNGADDFDEAKLPPDVPDTDVKNGATYTSAPFTTTSANTEINFHFNYVSSDGGDYADFAWARLLDGSGNQVALLFTARTHPTADIVPGQGMPAASATLTPPSVSISSGTDWSPLGSSSGDCYDDGCGHSGWVEAKYTIASAGAYRLEIGAINWDDDEYDSGLAVDGLLVGGVPPSVGGIATIPTLGQWALVLMGMLLAGMGAMQLQRRRG